MPNTPTPQAARIVRSRVPARDSIPAAFGGSRDGRLDRRSSGDQPDTRDTAWLRRNASAFVEADTRDFHLATVLHERHITELARLVRERVDLLAVLEVEREALDALEHRERPQVSTLVKGPGEVNTSDAIVLQRRLGPWLKPIAAKKAELARIDADLRGNSSAAARAYSVLASGFDAARVHSERLHARHQAVAYVYVRWFSRALKGSSQRIAASDQSTAIPVPAWTTSPNPWVPAGYTPEENTSHA